MKTIEEMKERAITRIIFDYTNKFGIKNMKGMEAYWATLQAYESIFGKEVYEEILQEVENRMSK